MSPPAIRRGGFPDGGMGEADMFGRGVIGRLRVAGDHRLPDR